MSPSGLAAPAQPHPASSTLVLARVQSRLQRPDGEVAGLAELIASDPVLSAAVELAHRACHPTAPGAGVREAARALGLAGLSPIVAGTALRGALAPAGLPGLTALWAVADARARSCAGLARKLGCSEVVTAYALGLLHDCGMAVMAGRHGDYLQVMETLEGDEPLPLTGPETRHFGTQHTRVGCELLRAWNLGQSLREAVLLHHSLGDALDGGCAPETRELLCVLTLARYLGRDRGVEREWARVSEPVMRTLGLSHGGLAALQRAFG